MTATRDGKAPLAPRSRSRQKILDAALGAFSRRGFHETRMEDIAALAGVAKGTLYYNFPSKADLFAALVCEGMEMFITVLDREIVSDLPFPEHFRRLVGVHVELLLRWRDLFVTASNPVTHGFAPDIVERVEAARDRYVGYVAGIIRKGQETGYLRPLDPDLLASEILGIIDGILRHQSRTRAPHSRDALTSEVHALLVHGLLAPRPARDGAGAEPKPPRGDPG
jgi:AcrR family transcriptional regulator